MKITSLEAFYHRNGVSGAPFHVGTFTEGKRKMFFVLFDKPAHCAVFNYTLLKEGELAFGKNSWRGDDYEPSIRKILEEN